MNDFIVQFQNKKIVGNIIGEPKPRLMFLHGAGKSTKVDFDKLRAKLAENDISSAAFDFIGHGRTGGDLNKSCLSERTEQALAVIKALELQPPLIIIGKSMSGYTAIKLTEKIPVETLVLIVPAVYSRDAYKIKFGPDFTKIIHRPKNWVNSDAWSILKKFNGKLLIIAAQDDEVIPQEVIQRLYSSALHAKNKELYIFPKANHNIMKFLDKNEDEFEFIFRKILNIINAT